MLRKTILSALLLIAVSICNAQQGYTNPILPGFNPDPSICRVGDDYYIVTSSFEYFPGLPIYHSRDLVNWQHIGHCLTRDSQLPLQGVNASGGLFAPSLRYHDGLFYAICTNVSHGGNFFCTATDPAGEWSDPTYVDVQSIDPDIFWDEDGKTYFITQGDEAIRITEIDLKTGKKTGPETMVWSGTGGRFPEAPHLYRKDGYYYLLMGEGGTEYAHSASIARSRHIYGPYESCPLNPIITHCNWAGQGNVIQGTGHADLIQAADGSWWTVFLGFRVTQRFSYYHILGRETFLAPVDWPTGGWPQVNGNGTVDLVMNVPTLPLHPFAPAPERTEFDETKLGVEWQYLRNPIRENYSLSDKKGSFRITASPYTLDEAQSVSAVLRRQTEHVFSASTHLTFNPRNEREEAGVALIQNNTHHYDLRLVKKGNTNAIQLRVRAGSIDYIAFEQPVSGNEVELKIEGMPLQYIFYYRTPGDGAYKELGRMDTRYLATEVAGGFTGVMIGLYASGGRKKTNSKAYFDWFEYKAVPEIQKQAS